MTTKQAAGSQPAAGDACARTSLSTKSTRANMHSATSNPGSTATADFTQINEVTKRLAIKLGIRIVGCAKGFNAYKDGDIISPNCTPEQLLCWLAGYEGGKDDLQIFEQIEQLKPLLAEIAKAEIVIQVLLAQMSDKKRKAAADVLQVAGFSFCDALQIKARREVASAARSALAAVAASGVQ